MVLFNDDGAPDAEEIIIAMGSACETIQTVVEKLNAEGRKVGLLAVHLASPVLDQTFYGCCS